MTYSSASTPPAHEAAGWRHWLRSPQPLMAPGPHGDDGARDRERDHGWVLRLWLLIAAFVVIGLWRSHVMDIPFRDPRGEWLQHRLVFTAGIVAALALGDALLRSWQATRGLGGTMAMLRRRWPARRVGLVALGLAAYHTVYFTYHNLKSWDVFNTPRDTMLAEWDRWLFFGHDPAVLLHDALGQHYATYVLIAIYESFPTFVSFAFPAALVLADRMRHGYVYIASAAWVWIFGVGCYYLIPSLGPFDEDPQNFAGLPHTIVTDTQAKYMAQRAHLLADPGAPDAAAQVSAFASLHVAVTLVIVLMLRYYGFRRLSLAMGLYLVGTIIATVHLGWHYVLDDVAGIVIAVAAVWLGHRTIYPSGWVPQEAVEPVPARSGLMADAEGA